MVAELRKLKASETGDRDAQIKVWDFRYYQNQLKKQKYAVDTEALRVYFPFQKTLEGMFNIYQSIFGLKFEKIAVPQKWIDEKPQAVHRHRRRRELLLVLLRLLLFLLRRGQRTRR